MEHRDRRGRRGVAVGRPRVQRPDPREDAEADVKGEEDPALQRTGKRGGLEVEERERAGSGVDVESEDADQDERRPEQEVQRQLHRGVFFRPDPGLPVRPRENPAGSHLPRGAPDADQQVHRQHGQLVEEEQDEEIEGHEHAVDTGHQRQQERVELLAADRHGPRREDAGHDDDRRQQHHQEADPVDTELVRDPERRHERDLLVELESRRLALVRDVDPEREHGRDAGRHRRDQPHGARAPAGREHDQERADEGRPRDDREQRQGHRHSWAQTKSSRTPKATP